MAGVPAGAPCAICARHFTLHTSHGTIQHGRCASWSRSNSMLLRLQPAHLPCCIVPCAVWSAEHLRHTSLKARVRACAVHSSDPLEPSLVTCPTARPETGFVLTFGLPFEGSWWSKLGFGFFFFSSKFCLVPDKIGQGSLWLCFAFVLSRGLFYVSLSYWGVLRFLITKSARPFGVWVFGLITLVRYVSKLICILLTS